MEEGGKRRAQESARCHSPWGEAAQGRVSWVSGEVLSQLWWRARGRVWSLEASLGLDVRKARHFGWKVESAGLVAGPCPFARNAPGERRRVSVKASVICAMCDGWSPQPQHGGGGMHSREKSHQALLPAQVLPWLSNAKWVLKVEA